MATRGRHPNNTTVAPTPAKTYTHTDQTALMRPDVGTQAQFKKRKEPMRYSYDHPIPLLPWDGQNPAREQGELLIRENFGSRVTGRGEDIGREAEADVATVP